MSRNDLPAVMAAKGKEGVIIGKDYRGVPVIAVLNAVPGTNWFMVTKKDVAEVYAGWRLTSTIIILLMLAIAMAVTAALEVFWLRSEKAHYKIVLEADKTIGEMEERHRVTLLSVSDGIITTDPEGMVELLNPVAESLTGWTAEEARGKSLEEVFNIVNAGTRHRVESPAHRAAREGIAVQLASDTVLISRDGTVRMISCSGAPIRNIRGGITGVVLIFRDQTTEREAQKMLRDSEERFRGTLDNMMEGCQIIGSDWRYLYVNKAAAEHGRNKREELIGRSMLELYPGIQNSATFAVLEKCMRERSREHLENEFFFPNDEKGWFQLAIQPVPEGIFVLSIDITRRKKTEEELEKHRDHLEELVEERTAELAVEKERAEATDKLKSVFLASMSHELRTPLNSIIGFTGILLMGLAGEMNEEQNKQLRMVKNSANHLLSLINDILDISKIEAGKVELSIEKFKMIGVVNEAMETMTPAANMKDLKLIAELPHEIEMYSDRRRVKQILMNLAGNAVKFTERGDVRITAKIVNGEKVEVRVADTGIGIKEEHMKLLFSPFQQLGGDIEKRHEGTGLGLHLCRRLTELLHGDIRAESKLGVGSTFIFNIPIRHEEEYHCEKDTCDRG